MKTTRTTLSLICALVAMAATAQDGYRLHRVAKVGESHRFEIKAAMAVMGMQVEFSAKVAEKVSKVDDDGTITIEASQSDIKVKFGDQEFSPDDAGGTIFTKSKPNGEILEMTGEDVDADALRRANLSLFVAPDNPVKVGDKWSFEVKANEKNGNTSGKADYEVLAVEKVGDEEAVVVKFSYKETSGGNPASGEGKVWLSPKGGYLLKMEADFKQAPIPGLGEPADMKISVNKIG